MEQWEHYSIVMRRIATIGLELSMIQWFMEKENTKGGEVGGRRLFLTIYYS